MNKLKFFFLLFPAITLSYGLMADAQDIREYKEIQCSFTPINDSINHHSGCRHQSTRPKNLQDSDSSEASESLVWSGYSSLTNLDDPKNYSVEEVSGSWIVPTLSATLQNTYSVAWVGIDGFFSSSQTVEQIGTAHNWIDGSSEYYAWFEMYPQASYTINDFPVNPGDQISAKVKYVGHNVFQLYICNDTQEVLCVVPQSLTVQPLAVRTSASWIVEAPTDENTETILPLANFGTIFFNHCKAVIRDRKGTISDKHWQYSPITMVTEFETTKAYPSDLEDRGRAFNVTWVSE